MFDTHMHTIFSTDSQMRIEEAVKASQRLGLGIILTDHMDINFPRKGEFIFNVDEYFDKYSKYKNDRTLLGIELGIRDDCIEENRKIALNHSFDYVIGSVHVIDNIDIYDEEFYEGSNKKSVYEKYLRSIYDGVKMNDFIDSIGHIDYIARYARYEDKELYINEFSDIIDEILKTIIQNNITLELNSRRLGLPDAFNNMMKIYKRYYELGGRNVCLGSDAHKASDIGSNFKEAKEIADLCKLKIIYFKCRKTEYDN